MLFPSSPFIECPKCHNKTFGVLSIGPFSYDRRCAGCDYPRGTNERATYPLPELNKKIIYLDQSVFSNFMKALNPAAGRIGKIDPKWKKLFEQFDRLNKLQMLVCPISNIHRQESLVYELGEDVKRVYELLSHRVSFHDFCFIWGRQLIESFDSWLEDRAISEVDHKISRVVQGEINVWPETIYVTVALPKDQEWLEYYKQVKEKAHAALLLSYERWKNKSNFRFNDWFSEEIEESVKISKKMFHKDILEAAMIRKKIDASNASDLVDEFYKTTLIEKLPTMRMLSALYAQLGHQVSSGGRVQPKDKGEANDLKSLAIALPYCDVFVADIGTIELLKQIPKNKIQYKAKVFNVNEVEKVSEYLESIENSISQEHKNKVIEVYDESRLQPYTTIFSDEG